MYNDIVNNYTNYISKKEIAEQKKRKEIIKSNNKSLNEDQFKENLKKVKENLRNV
jgi:hypothetical protein